MLDFESLLTPLAEDAPSGPDLEYDPVFLQLEQAGSGKPEQQFGNTLIPAEQPDWRTVQEHVHALATRTRDLRLAVWLTRCGARLGGISAGVDGLRFVHGLLSTRWPDVHPQLDRSDGDDPTMRMNALSPLAAPEAVLADLRSAALTGARGSMRVRDIELGLGQDSPTADETVLSESGAIEAMRIALAQDGSLAPQLTLGREAAEGIVRTIDERLGGAAGPELQPLIRLLRMLDDCSRKLLGVSDAATEDAARPEKSAATVDGAPGSINSRDDVVRALDRLCEWIERHEPSNPAPLLLRRAQRLMSKSFIDIVRDLAPEGLGQIEKLAGIQTSGE